MQDARCLTAFYGIHTNQGLRIVDRLRLVALPYDLQPAYNASSSPLPPPLSELIVYLAFVGELCLCSICVGMM